MTSIHFERMMEPVHRHLADRRGDEFLYRLWRAYFRRPSEVAEFIAMGRAHPSPLARSAAALADTLVRGAKSELADLEPIRRQLAY
jgi:hypothetical protein